MNLLGGITKIGEGYTNPEAHIPIDIHYNKLIDWLIDRKKVQVTWKKQLKPIQDKIQGLLKELPTDIPELASYSRREKINYYDCVQILKLLIEKGNEPPTKNLFGSYTSKKLKDWDETIRAYETECVHIADAGNALIALINFDLPAFKRSIEQNKKLISELTRKTVEYERNVQSFKKRYEESCVEWGIQGISLRKELSELVSGLPACFDEVVEAIQQDDIRQAVQYYLDFMNHSLSVESTGQTKTPSLPILQYMLDNGNQTIDAYNHKDDPKPVVTEIKNPEPKVSEQNTENKSLEIDWTVIDSESEKPAEAPVINWDIAVEETGQEEGQPSIVWDINVDEAQSTESKQLQLDLDVDMNGITAIELVEANSGGSATETGLESLLENAKMRNMLLNELLELRCFLLQREAELTDDKVTFLTSLVTPILKTNLGADAIAQCLQQLNYVIDLIETSRMRQLLELKNSKRFLDRVVSSFEHLIECQEKSAKSIEYTQKKIEDLQEQTDTIFPKLEAATNQAKELKSALEATLSAQYGGRTVNLYGEEINRETAARNFSRVRLRMEGASFGILKVLNLTSFTFNVVIYALSAYGLIGHGSTADISDKYENTLTPASYASHIWILIYVLQAIYVIYQVLPIHNDTKRDYVFGLGIFLPLSWMLEGFWVIAYCYKIIWLSLIIMMCTLGSIATAHFRLEAVTLRLLDSLIGRKDVYPKYGKGFKVLIFTFLYCPTAMNFGWIFASTISNLATFIEQQNGSLQDGWTATLLVGGAISAGLMLLFKREIIFALAAFWGFIAIAVKQDEDGKDFASIVAFSCSGVIFVGVVVASFLELLFAWRRKQAEGEEEFLDVTEGLLGKEDYDDEDDYFEDQEEEQ